MANVEERLMTQDSGLILDEHFIASTVTSGDPAIEESMNFVWKTMKKIQNLDLLPEELSVTTGVAIMHSGKCHFRYKLIYNTLGFLCYSKWNYIHMYIFQW